MLNRRILSLPALASFFLATASAQTGYVLDSTLDQLYSIDLATANVTLIGSTLNNGLTTPAGLTWRTDLGELWTIDLAGGEAGSLDVTNGTFTPVLMTALSGWQAIAWDATQSTFILANQNGSNYELDPVTGMTTLLGPSGFSLITAMDSDPAGVVWGIDFNGAVVSIDTTSGAGTQSATTTAGFQGLAIDDAGVWYAVNTNSDSLFTIDPATGATTSIGVMPGLQFTKGFEIPPAGGGNVGTNYCTAVANSTGSAASMSASGSATVASNNLVLETTSMPQNSFGYFLTSLTQGLVMNPGGSVGNLCLGGSIGRYVGPGQVQNSGAAGAIALPVDLTQHPTPTGLVSVQVGETWNFTAWYRDAVGGVAVSNFADGLEILFN